MFKKSLILAAVLSAVPSFAGMGLGYDAMLGGVSGLSVQYPITSKLGVQVIGEAGYENKAWAYGTGMRFSYALASEGNATLSLGLGGGYLAAEDNHFYAPFAEIPVGVDYKFGDHFSVTGQTGIVYQAGSNEKWVLFNQGGSNFLGAFAFHYWF